MLNYYEIAQRKTGQITQDQRSLKVLFKCKELRTDPGT